MRGPFFTGWEAGAVRRVLHDMRPMDAEEAFALQPHDDPDRLFAMLVLSEPQFVFVEIVWRSLLPGRPVAYIAIVPSTPRVAEAGMIATPEMGPRDFAVWRRRLREKLPGICARAGIRRLQCRALATHLAAADFLAGCGWRFEGLERGLGRNGENFARWAVLAGDISGADTPRQAEELTPCAS